MNAQADRDLVELARRGDGAAIGELFSRYWRAARAAAYGVTGEFGSAEDAAAEGFRQAWTGLDSLREPERFGAWLRTIVVRQARVEQQRRRAEAADYPSGLPDPNERADDALGRIELGALVQQAVRELPDRLREAMALFYFEGYDSDAAARFLEIPPGTLRRRLHEGREQLRGVAEQLLKGSKRMNEERESKIERLRSMIDNGEIYQGLRESLALRPPPKDLADLILRKGTPPTDGIREMAYRILCPSKRASDPNHPVGAVAAAIRKVLPEFEEWPMDAGEAAVRFLTFSGEHRDRLKIVLPPGFAEGRPGAWLRPTRALIRLSGGLAQSMYQLLQDSPDEQTFRAARESMRLSDALDLTWMVDGPLELRSVQEVLERVTSAVMPGEQVRFSAYEEPRYRSALQLQSSDASRLAIGGVLTEWAGRPQGVDSAHVRIFLEPWAAIRLGQVIGLDCLPGRS